MARRWLLPRLAKQMSLTEAAWLAGFFDGEGSLSQCPPWQLTLANTNKASVDRCQTYTGAGSVKLVKSYTAPAHWSPKWVWKITRQRDIEAVCRQMLPYLIIKRRVVEAFLSVWTDIGAFRDSGP